MPPTGPLNPVERYVSHPARRTAVRRRFRGRDLPQCNGPRPKPWRHMGRRSGTEPGDLTQVDGLSVTSVVRTADCAPLDGWKGPLDALLRARSTALRARSTEMSARWAGSTARSTVSCCAPASSRRRFPHLGCRCPESRSLPSRAGRAARSCRSRRRASCSRPGTTPNPRSRSPRR